MKRVKAATIIIFQILCLAAGGAVALIVTSLNYFPATTNGTVIYTFTSLFMLAFIVIIEIGSAVKIHDSTVHTVFTSISLFLNFLFSDDVLTVLLGTHPHIAALTDAAEYVGFMTFVLIVLTHVYLLNYLNKSGITRTQAAIFIGYSAAICILFTVLQIFSYEFIAYLAYIPAIVWGLYKIYKSALKKRGNDATFALTLTIYYAALGMQTQQFLYRAGAIPYIVYGVESTYVFLICIMYICVYVSFLIKTERDALKASEYKLETERMKTKLLREQINPHFIFNSLITVKDAYHENLEQGDIAMGYFSRYLRSNVEAMNLDCIPFDDELDNIENYIHLESLKRKNAVNIIYDIEYSDFNVPVLSLQTFVENAVKYARTEEKTGGYIAVSSRKTENGAAVEIFDNGIGFNVKHIKPNSCGIRNATERFKLLLGGTVTIESSHGKGTTVKIFIPVKQTEIITEDNDADNNS